VLLLDSRLVDSGLVVACNFREMAVVVGTSSMSAWGGIRGRSMGDVKEAAKGSRRAVDEVRREAETGADTRSLANRGLPGSG
jgi:hypothetical protein